MLLEWEDHGSLSCLSLSWPTPCPKRTIRKGFQPGMVEVQVALPQEQ